MLHVPNRPVAALVLAAALAVLPGAAHAQTHPANDDIEGATPISVPGGVEDQATSGATAGPTDPQTCWDPDHYTVWYRTVAPETGTLRVAAFASLTVPAEDPSHPGEGPFDLPTGVAVFRGVPSALVSLGCSTRDFDGGGVVDTPVQAGSTIYVVAAGLQSSSANTFMSLRAEYVGVAPQVDVDVDAVGRLRAGGVARVTGTLRCDVDTSASVVLTLSQRSRGAQPSSATTSAACTPAGSRWTLDVVATDGAPFHPGRARVEGVVTAGGDGPVTSVPVSTSVVLRPAARAR